MQSTWKQRILVLFTATVLSATVTLAVAPPASGAVPQLVAPSDVRVSRVNATEAVLAWTPTSTNPDVGYELRTRSGEFFSLAGPSGEPLRFLDPGTSRTLIVRAYFFDGTTLRYSAASAPVEVRTPTPPPLDVRLTGRTGNTVTLAWTRPNIGSAPVPTYKIADGTRLETTSLGTQVTIHRLRAGQTHRLAVSYEFSKYGAGSSSISPTSAPIDVAVPATGDTTSPTAPTNVVARFDFDLCETVLTWTPSTDNATPQADLQYETISGSVVQKYDVKPGVTSPTNSASEAIRAVDASGNRSAAVPIVFAE